MPSEGDRFVKAAGISDIEKRREPTKHYVSVYSVVESSVKNLK